MGPRSARRRASSRPGSQHPRPQPAAPRVRRSDRLGANGPRRTRCASWCRRRAAAPTAGGRHALPCTTLARSRSPALRGSPRTRGRRSDWWRRSDARTRPHMVSCQLVAPRPPRRPAAASGTSLAAADRFARASRCPSRARGPAARRPPGPNPREAAAGRAGACHRARRGEWACPPPVTRASGSCCPSGQLGGHVQAWAARRRWAPARAVAAVAAAMTAVVPAAAATAAAASTVAPTVSAAAATPNAAPAASQLALAPASERQAGRALTACDERARWLKWPAPRGWRCSSRRRERGVTMVRFSAARCSSHRHCSSARGRSATRSVAWTARHAFGRRRQASAWSASLQADFARSSHTRYRSTSGGRALRLS